MKQPRLRVTVADNEVWDDPSDREVQRLFAGLNARRHYRAEVTVPSDQGGADLVIPFGADRDLGVGPA